MKTYYSSSRTVLLMTVVVIAIMCSNVSYGQFAGVPHERYVINNDNNHPGNGSASDTYLRIQRGNNEAWNIRNRSQLGWFFSNNPNHSDMGVQKMQLTTSGQLFLPDGGGLSVNASGSSPGFGQIMLYNDHNGGEEDAMITLRTHASAADAYVFYDWSHK
ncbi:MAG: hypothetical protein AAFY41_17300, partial [Bacteroidota bacterium]